MRGPTTPATLVLAALLLAAGCADDDPARVADPATTPSADAQTGTSDDTGGSTAPASASATTVDPPTLAGQRAMWAAAGIDTYVFSAQRAVNPEIGPYNACRMSVVDDQPGDFDGKYVWVDYVDDVGCKLEMPRTIDEVFALVEQLGEGADITWSSMGYPTRVRVDELDLVVCDLVPNSTDLESAQPCLLYGDSNPTGADSTPTWAEGAGDTATLSCDAYPIGPDGTVATEPSVTGYTGSVIVSPGTAPTSAAVGQPFAVLLGTTSMTLTSDVAGLAVLDHGAITRRYQVAGATVMPGSAILETPGEPPSTLTADATTVAIEATSAVPGGGTLTLPQARFEVVAAAPGSVVVTLNRYEETLQLKVGDGAPLVVRASCTVDPATVSTTSVS